jgi:hypothetical protein
MPLPQLVATSRALLSGNIAIKPNTVPNLAFWLDASQIAGTNNNAVTTGQLTDLSPSAIPVNTSTPPTFISSGQNGLPILRFDGSTQYIRYGDVLPFVNGFTAFVVFKFNSTGSFYQVFSRSDGTVNAPYEVRRNSTTNALTALAKVGGTSQSINSNTYTVTSFNLTSLIVNPAVNVQFFLAGAANGTTAFSPTGTIATLATNFEVGRRSNGAFFAAMDLAEMAIYNTAAMAASDITGLTSYFKNKWGV